MKIVTIMGSPHRNGTTAAALAMFEAQVAGSHEVDSIVLADFEVKGCQGCFACQQTVDAPGCVLPDDGNGLLERIQAADAVVYATPLHMWGIASGLRGLLERHLSMVSGYMTEEWRSLVDGKPAALLVAAGGPVEGNADAIQTVFERVCQYAKAKHVGTFVVPGCTTPEKLGTETEGIAKKLADGIVA